MHINYNITKQIGNEYVTNKNTSLIYIHTLIINDRFAELWASDRRERSIGRALVTPIGFQVSFK